MSIIPKQIKAIIFDLDDTLYDCSGSLVLKSRKLTAKIISKTIDCSQAKPLKLQSKLEEKYGPQSNIFRKIKNLYNLSDDFYKEISSAANTIEVNGIKLFPDVLNSINELRRIGYKLFLVTTGNRDIQEKKIKALGLENAFVKIIITNNTSGKEKSFKDILNRYSLEPEQVLCVGDKIKDEIEVGKNLGMHTALIKHGRHYNFYKSENKDSLPDMNIIKISDLLKNQKQVMGTI